MSRGLEVVAGRVGSDAHIIHLVEVVILGSRKGLLATIARRVSCGIYETDRGVCVKGCLHITVSADNRETYRPLPSEKLHALRVGIYGHYRQCITMPLIVTIRGYCVEK